MVDNLSWAFAPPANRTLIIPQISKGPLKYGLNNRLLSTSINAGCFNLKTTALNTFLLKQRRKTTLLKQQRPQPYGRSLCVNLLLATQTQTTDQRNVTRGVLRLQVVQQLTTLVYHPDQTTT